MIYAFNPKSEPDRDDYDYTINFSVKEVLQNGHSVIELNPSTSKGLEEKERYNKDLGPKIKKDQTKIFCDQKSPQNVPYCILRSMVILESCVKMGLCDDAVEVLRMMDAW